MQLWSSNPYITKSITGHFSQDTLGSDHLPIFFELSPTLKKNSPQPTQQSGSIDYRLIDQQTYRKLIHNALPGLLQKWNQLNLETIDMAIKDFTCMIQTSAEAATTRTKPFIKKFSWWNAKLENLNREIKKFKWKFYKHRLPGDKIALAKARCT